MKRESVSAAAVALVLLAAILASGFYVGGYFLLSDTRDGVYHDITGEETAARCRYFDSEWLESAYEPAARIEEAIVGKTVLVSS